MSLGKVTVEAKHLKAWRKVVVLEPAVNLDNVAMIFFELSSMLCAAFINVVNAKKFGLSLSTALADCSTIGILFKNN